MVLIRMQADQAKPLAERYGYKNAVHGLFRMVKDEGFAQVGRSLNLTVFRAILTNTGQLASYALLTEAPLLWWRRDSPPPPQLRCCEALSNWTGRHGRRDRSSLSRQYFRRKLSPNIVFNSADVSTPGREPLAQVSPSRHLLLQLFCLTQSTSTAISQPADVIRSRLMAASRSVSAPHCFAAPGS